MLNTPEALETLRLLLDARPCVQPSYSNWWRETAKAFVAGDTAMTALFSNYASEITGLSTKIASDIGTTFVPGGNPLMGGGSIGVCRYSQNKKEALNFIRWFCSEEIASAMTYLGSASPCQATYDNYQIIDCIRVKHRLHKGQRAQSRERWRFAKQIQPDLDCGKKEVQWEGAVRQALPNSLGYFYRYTPVPAGFTT